MSPRRPERQPRTGLLVQTGQTLLVLGAALLVIGLLLGNGDLTVWIGLVLLVVGLPLLVVGLRRQRGGDGTSVPPPPGPPGA